MGVGCPPKRRHIVERPGNAQAPILGVNLRVDLLKALQATWETATVSMEAVAAAHITFDPITWGIIGTEAVGAARTIVAALVQSMSAIDYITYVILSQHPDGMSEDDLAKEVKSFVKQENATKFAFYLGMDGARSRAAADATDAPGWLETTLKKRAKDGMVERPPGRVHAKPRNFTIGWDPE
jgi:hypothetical protein